MKKNLEWKLNWQIPLEYVQTLQKKVVDFPTKNVDSCKIHENQKESFGLIFRYLASLWTTTNLCSIGEVYTHQIITYTAHRIDKVCLSLNINFERNIINSEWNLTKKNWKQATKTEEKIRFRPNMLIFNKLN